MPMPGSRKYVSGRPSRPGLANSDKRAECPVGPQHVALGRLRLDDRAPHADEVGDPLGLGIELEVREDQHAAQAVSDPVHPVVTRLALDVVEDRRHVVPDQVVDGPAIVRLARGTGSAGAAVDPIIPAGPGVLARAPDVEDVDLVAARRQLAREMIVGDRPERGIEPQPMTEDHRQLARVRMLGR